MTSWAAMSLSTRRVPPEKVAQAVEVAVAAVAAEAVEADVAVVVAGAEAAVVGVVAVAGVIVAAVETGATN
jgi:hypothetical protein